MNNINYCLQCFCLGVVQQALRLFGVLSSISIAISLSGCESGARHPGSFNASGNHHKYRADESTTRRNRAAYWRARGYDFDPREMSASQMDFYAANFDSAGWAGLLDRVHEANKLEAKAAAENLARQKMESVISSPRAFSPPKQSGPDSTPALIVPRPKPLPAIGP